jgi:hypothetical protein
VSANYPIKIRVYDRELKTMKPLESYNGEVMKKLVVLMTDPEPKEDSRYVFCRYTGMQDVKGRDIYEGDIVQSTGHNKNRQTAVWREGKKRGAWSVSMGGHPKQIVGNIYTKPLRPNQPVVKRSINPNAKSRHTSYKPWNVVMTRKKANPDLIVDERWLSSPDGFDNFVADMGPRPSFKLLSRHDMNGPFNKENCYWEYSDIHNLRTRGGAGKQTSYGRGVSRSPQGKYKAYAGSAHAGPGGKHFLGTFDTVQEAQAAREAYIEKLRGKFDETYRRHQDTAESS